MIELGKYTKVHRNKNSIGLSTPITPSHMNLRPHQPIRMKLPTRIKLRPW